MSEYTLIKDITSYTYPNHYKPSKDWGSFHYQWIKSWNNLLSSLIGKDDISGIEIGTFHGSCTVWLLDKVFTGNNSILYTINPKSNEYIETNLKPYKNVIFLENTSYEALIKLSIDKQNSFDFIYIDGCHFSKYVLEDAILSFRLLKMGGLMIFDDYGWGIHTLDNKLKPKTAIDGFLAAYDGHYKLIQSGWQVCIQKINCNYNEEEIKSTKSYL